MAGPLTGLKVIEMVGIGPAPFAAMCLSDLGAEIVRVDRPKGEAFLRGDGSAHDFLGRNRPSVAVDLKNPRGVETVLRMVDSADGLLEGFRPGVMERLGLGPEVCLARNPGLVFGRMTGWGQEGPLANDVGHDINYIALSGALHAIGRKGQAPTPPLNLVGDFGGGGLLLAYGMLAAWLERIRSGQGQVVDAAMVDGATMLMASIHGAAQVGFWSEERGTNLLDTGSHFYDVYETKDGKWVSIGSIEPQFYVELIRRLGLEGEDLPDQMDKSQWPKMKERFAAIFRTRTRDEWCAVFEGGEVCFAPVLEMREAPDHPHNRARAGFVDFAGARAPAPAPRFSRTPGEIRSVSVAPGTNTDEVLADYGFSDDEIAGLREAGAVA
ncbi:MAG: carnitine dehydratase [Deltaproteobacteria bacterium]|nr:carnitine dehydratase [Deltaproteobacteria bacterium]